MKKMAKRGGNLHDEHQALISYFASKASPSETARILYNVLLLASDKNAPDVVTTIRYCLDDARISGEVEKVFRQKTSDIERSYNWLTEDHMDVIYSIGSRTSYNEFDRERATELLDAVNEFYTAAGTLERMMGRRPATIDDSVLSGIPRIIRRLGYANPEEHLSRRPTPRLRELIERSKDIAGPAEFIERDWKW
jgi:hypothetical protein